MARDASPPPPHPRPLSSPVGGGGGTAAAAASASVTAAASAGRRQPASETPVRHVDNVTAYDAWAAVYDSDGNILQSVDDLELEEMLPRFLEGAVGRLSGDEAVFRVLDLGCGTGRNTEKVVRWWEERRRRQGDEKKGGGGVERMEVTGVDASKGMLGKAKERLIPLVETSDATTLNLLNLDPFFATTLPAPLRRPLQRYHAVVSTLVLEHVPLDPFFRTLAALLAPAAVALVSNMHPDMGAVSQAGFVATDVGGGRVKVRGTSWAHGIAETVEKAGEVGLGLVLEGGGGEDGGAVEGVRERAVDEGLIRRGMVGGRGWKWVGTKVWFGFVVGRINGGGGGGGGGEAEEV
ncbi:hypothetical protein SLS58_008945 [Diplodia intermedia]|uniref:Methyltransferase domain-containing protein n=1 Tax=Diplodia intermedia TaxID=856260 RepID=A0ABR3TEZ7_9PEZI